MKNRNMSKIFMIFGISMLVIALIGSTFAYYVWNTSDDEETKIVTSIGSATVYFDGGSIMENVNIRPVESKEYGIEKNISIAANTTGLTFNLYLDLITLPDALKEESFRYALYNGESLIQEGNFSSDYLSSNTTTCSTNNTPHLTLLTNETILTTTTTYTLYIWIDGANYTNPSTMMNQEFSFKLHADGEKALLKEGPIPDITQMPDTQKKTLAYKILSDYYYADKSDILNNNITYHYDAEHSLMADIGGNVRYYGASPNNYVYFNCSDYSNQSDSTCEKWRIIGVFDGKVKITRSGSIGIYSYDNSTNCGAWGCNNWTAARLMKLLNPGYESETIGGSLYYNSGSGTCYVGGANATASCDFTSTGIKNDITRNMIAEVVWNLGGANSTSVYSDQIYEYERGTVVYGSNSTSWTGKIAIPYASDYGYAADFESCSKTLAGYNSCTSVNWMTKYTGIQKNYPIALLTPYSGIGASIFNILNYYLQVNGIGNARNGTNILPVLYLSSQLEIKSGDGSSSLPYQLQ